MKNLDEFIKRINFRAAVRIYLTVSALLLVICLSATVYMTRDKIQMAFDYDRLAHTFEKQYTGDNAKLEAEKLRADSKDIVNIIIVNKENNIVYKSNNSLVGSSAKLSFTIYDANRNYLQDNINENALYRIVKEDNILLNKDYIKKDEELKSNIDDEIYFEKDISSKNIYLINYKVNRASQDKIFIIRTADVIPYAERMLEITGALAGLIFIIYWIGLALWVYKDAYKKRLNPALWGFLVLLTNLAGLFIYFMYKQNSIICYNCGVLQSKENIYCSHCGSKINEQCKNCGSIVNKNENYCSRCGKDLIK